MTTYFQWKHGTDPPRKAKWETTEWSGNYELPIFEETEEGRRAFDSYMAGEVWHNIVLPQLKLNDGGALTCGLDKIKDTFNLSHADLYSACVVFQQHFTASVYADRADKTCCFDFVDVMGYVIWLCFIIVLIYFFLQFENSHSSHYCRVWDQAF